MYLRCAGAFAPPHDAHRAPLAAAWEHAADRCVHSSARLAASCNPAGNPEPTSLQLWRPAGCAELAAVPPQRRNGRPCWVGLPRLAGSGREVGLGKTGVAGREGWCCLGSTICCRRQACACLTRADLAARPARPQPALPADASVFLFPRRALSVELYGSVPGRHSLDALRGYCLECLLHMLAAPGSSHRADEPPLESLHWDLLRWALPYTSTVLWRGGIDNEHQLIAIIIGVAQNQEGVAMLALWCPQLQPGCDPCTCNNVQPCPAPAGHRLWAPSPLPSASPKPPIPPPHPHPHSMVLQQGPPAAAAGRAGSRAAALHPEQLRAARPSALHPGSIPALRRPRSSASGQRQHRWRCSLGGAAGWWSRRQRWCALAGRPCCRQPC